jgi:hypothetical protein
VEVKMKIRDALFLIVFVLIFILGFYISITSASTCPSNIGVCNPDLPFQSAQSDTGTLRYVNYTAEVNETYVPYQGANRNVELGGYSLNTTGFIQADDMILGYKVEDVDKTITYWTNEGNGGITGGADLSEFKIDTPLGVRIFADGVSIVDLWNTPEFHTIVEFEEGLYTSSHSDAELGRNLLVAGNITAGNISISGKSFLRGVNASNINTTSINSKTINATDINSTKVNALYYNSTATTGTQPYSCTSTTMNKNLNADLWDGNHFATYLDQALLTTSYTVKFGNLWVTGDNLGTYGYGRGGILTGGNITFLNSTTSQAGYGTEVRLTIQRPLAAGWNYTVTVPSSTGTLYITGGTDVSVADGGTGKSSFTANQLIYASATTTLSQSNNLIFNGTLFNQSGSFISNGKFLINGSGKQWIYKNSTFAPLWINSQTGMLGVGAVPSASTDAYFDSGLNIFTPAGSTKSVQFADSAGNTFYYSLINTPLAGDTTFKSARDYNSAFCFLTPNAGYACYRGDGQPGSFHGYFSINAVNTTTRGSELYVNGSAEVSGAIITSNASAYLNFAVCYATDGMLGHCTDAVNETGGCTCALN